MDFMSEEERKQAMLFTAQYLPRFLGAIEKGLEGLGLKTETRFSYPDENCRSVINFVVEGEGFKATVILRGAFEDLLAVDGKADPVRIDMGMESEKYAAEKIAGIIEPLMKLLPAALEYLEPAPGRRSMSLLGGCLEVSLFDPAKWGLQP